MQCTTSNCHFTLKDCAIMARGKCEFGNPEGLLERPKAIDQNFFRPDMNVKWHKINTFNSSFDLPDGERANGNHQCSDDAESGGSVSDYAPSNLMDDLRHKSLTHRGTGIQTYFYIFHLSI